MRKSVVLCLVAAAMAVPAMARNTEYKLPLADVLQSPEAKARLDDSVKFYFGEKSMPAGAEPKGFDVISRISNAAKLRARAAANSFGGGPPPINSGRATSQQTDDIDDCKIAALDLLVEMQRKAKQVGANAVVDFVSYYRNVTFSSATEYECHAGGTGSHITFKATYSVLPKS